MLYVFIVSTGSMLKFDMNLAVKKVIELKTEIAKCVHTQVEEQVLLCSGGEELTSENIVGNYYGAGTDTNPIFFFSKYASDLAYPYTPKAFLDANIEDDVYGCASMIASSNTATVRCVLAQRFSELAGKGRRECDELVHGQHLQQQGWAAVVANFEDVKDALINRKVQFEELYKKYLANRPCYQETIQTFPEDIELLSKVPLLPKLMFGSDCVEEDLATEQTLLTWFCSEPRPVLEALAEKCHKSLEELDDHTLSVLNVDIENFLKNADNPDIKEVKGIEERLSLLNKQIEDAKKLEKDQHDIASWFTHSQKNMTRDPSVVQDLCATFQEQLLLMLKNHKCLKDILDRCTRAKTELSENINYRIKYICRVESEMYDLQIKIMFLERRVRSIIKQVESFRQVHVAPQRYLKLLSEVCRRKAFSSNFMKWATDLSAQAFKLYHKEITTRQGFETSDATNMVDNLFPGLDDVPPPFAIECPQPFDQKLPNISKEDLDFLRVRFPELAHYCEVLPPDPMPYLSQAESDSAFSSNIPSSRIAGDSADSGGKCQLERGLSSSNKLTAPSSDYISLPSEYTSLLNEPLSLTSSPFEDPLLLNADLESASKRTKASEFSSKNLPVVESDGEEFETVDRYESPVEIHLRPSDRKRTSHPRPNSTSEVIGVNRFGEEHCPKMSRARSDGDAISPITERLKSSESLVSNDFQSTEYYIDDSMPSSYTESNATSPLIRTSKMVKSHHVVVAELQKQMEEKNGALVGATSSLKSSGHNILKLHAQMSALQRFIEELQGTLRKDLSSLRDYVKEEFWERMAEVSQVVESVNKSMLELQRQMEADKEEALCKAKREAELLENQLEVEQQKLSDAESQIANYEAHLQQVFSRFDDLKHEKSLLESDLSLEKEKITKMMLEQELELDSLRNLMQQEIEKKEEDIFKVSEALSAKEQEIANVLEEKAKLQDVANESVKEKEKALAMLRDKERALNEMQEDHARVLDQLKKLEEARRTEIDSGEEEKLQSLLVSIQVLQAEIEKTKKEAADNESRLLALERKHKDDLESLRLRYNLAISTISPDNPQTSGLESAEYENLIDSEDLSDLEKIFEKLKEQLTREKENCVKSLLEECDIKVKEAIAKEQDRFTEEKEKLVATMQKEYQQNYEKMKAQFTAENQVSFNEAINRVAKEKDSIIESLRSKISALENSISSLQFSPEKQSSQDIEETKAMSRSDSGALSSCSKELERIQGTEGAAAPCSFVAPILPQAEMEIHQKYEKLDKEFKRLLNLKVSRQCVDCTYKLSVLSCDVGDFVLVCYEERHENFVVFHFGQYVHFLHSESIQLLGLKIPPGPTQRWGLGIVEHKDFCVTKKPFNRFKVTLGTKFYRVKVKPWDREKAMMNYHFHRQATCSSPPKSSEAESKTMSASSI